MDNEFTDYQFSISPDVSKINIDSNDIDTLKINVISNGDKNDLLRIECEYDPNRDNIGSILFSLSLDNLKTVLVDDKNNNLKNIIDHWYHQTLDDEAREEFKTKYPNTGYVFVFIKLVSSTIAMFYLLDYLYNDPDSTFFPFQIKLTPDEDYIKLLNVETYYTMKLIIDLYKCLPTYMLGSTLFYHYDQLFSSFASLFQRTSNPISITNDVYLLGIGRYMDYLTSNINNRIVLVDKRIKDGVNNLERESDIISEKYEKMKDVMGKFQKYMEQLIQEINVDIEGIIKETGDTIIEIKNKNINEVSIQTLEHKKSLHTESAKSLVDLSDKKDSCIRQLDKKQKQLEEVGDDKIILMCKKSDDYIELVQTSKDYLEELTTSFQNDFKEKMELLRETSNKVVEEGVNILTGAKISSLSEIVKTGRINKTGLENTTKFLISEFEKNIKQNRFTYPTENEEQQNVIPVCRNNSLGSYQSDDIENNYKEKIKELEDKVETLSKRLDNFISYHSI